MGGVGGAVTVDTTIAGYNTAASAAVDAPSTAATILTAGNNSQGIFAQSVGGGGGNGGSATGFDNSDSTSNTASFVSALGATDAATGGAARDGGVVLISNGADVQTGGANIPARRSVGRWWWW